MKLILSLALATVPPAATNTEPQTLCNATQERIVKRVEKLRQYSTDTFYKNCYEGNMLFTEKRILPRVLLTQPDGTTYICLPKGSDLLCGDPKNEKDAMDALEELYMKDKVKI